jgi:hypothetical protein
MINGQVCLGWFRGHGMGAADMPTFPNRLKPLRVLLKCN